MEQGDCVLKKKKEYRLDIQTCTHTFCVLCLAGGIIIYFNQNCLQCSCLGLIIGYYILLNLARRVSA